MAVNDDGPVGFCTVPSCMSGSAKITIVIAGAAGVGIARIRPLRYDLRAEPTRNAVMFILTHPFACTSAVCGVIEEAL